MVQPAIKKIMKWPAVCEATGLGKTRIAELIEAGEFPKPFKLAPNGKVVGFLETEILAYQNARTKQRITYTSATPKKAKAAKR